MSYRIAICDDDINIINTISEYLNLYSFGKGIDFAVSTFNHAVDLLNSYTQSGTYNILFLDVEMPDINGIELANRIRSIPDFNAFIVFISSYPEYMKDSFNVQAFQYLTKPVSKDAFYSEMNRIIDYFEKNNRTQMIIGNNSGDEVIFVDDIIYIENTNSKKKALRFVINKKAIDTTGILSDYETTLEGTNSFYSPARGFLVNIKHVHYIQKDCIIMDNGESIPLSRRREKKLREMFNEQLLDISSHR